VRARGTHGESVHGKIATVRFYLAGLRSSLAEPWRLTCRHKRQQAGVRGRTLSGTGRMIGFTRMNALRVPVTLLTRTLIVLAPPL
jgi:hypothetical protein